MHNAWPDGCGLCVRHRHLPRPIHSPRAHPWSLLIKNFSKVTTPNLLQWSIIKKITFQDYVHCGNTDMNDSLFHKMFQTYFPHKNLDQYLSWEPLGTVGSSLADVFAWKLKLKWLRVSSVKCSKYGSTEYNRKEYSTSKSSGYWAALWQTRCSCSIGSWRLKRRLTMDLCLRCTRSGVKP